MLRLITICLCLLADLKQPSEQLPVKLNQIQQELPQWIQKTGRVKEAGPLMKKLDEQIKGQDFDDAEQTADSILKLLADTRPLSENERFDDACKQLRHELGNSFLISRANVQDELKVSEDQKTKIHRFLKEIIPEAQKAFQSAETLKKNERQDVLQRFREQATEKFDAFLKTTINDDQKTRLRQLILHREGLFGDGRCLDDLQITQQQREQFIPVIQQAERQIESLVKEAHESGDPDLIRPRVLKIRAELQKKLEALLTEQQQKQWQGMLGKPFPMESLFE